MTIQPILPLPVLIPLSMVLVLLFGYLCYVSNRSLSRDLRYSCTVLYALAVLAILALLYNPGRIERTASNNPPVWLLAMDSSFSMKAPVRDDAQAESRLSVARDFMRNMPAPPQGGEVIAFAIGEEPVRFNSIGELIEYPAEGKSSYLLTNLASSLDTLRRRGRPVAGCLLIGDGRDTQPDALQTLISRAGAVGCPVHTLPLGSTWQEPDIALSTNNPLLSAYPGVDVRLAATVRNIRMGQRQLQVELLNPKGEVVETRTIEIEEGAERTVPFFMLAESGEYRIRVVPQPGESREDNNDVRLLVRPVSSRIRVFLAEGAPYWDSKFLAQYLRAQPVFDVRSVHRLSDNRFYHINTGDDDSEPTREPGMPQHLSDLMGYDIIVLGKGMEHLLNDESAQAIQSYVREQGGILVMARGRSYGGKMDALRELEPFIWATGSAEERRLIPTRQGELSGLFGQQLPAAGDPIWSMLPELDDVYAVSELAPGTQVLAEAEGTKTPLLALMRSGLGAVLCLNGEGLWKWDFYPEAREKQNMYREFWRQILPWVQTAAEFQPGFDMSLHAARAQVQVGESINANIGWRGTGKPEAVELIAINLADGKELARVPAQEVPSSGLPRWEATLPPLAAGEILLCAQAQGLETSSPECRVSVLAPPAEDVNLNADPELLARVAEHTGGRLFSTTPSADDWAAFFELPQGVKTEEEHFIPLWSEWLWLTSIVIALGLVWFARRRKGLL